MLHRLCVFVDLGDRGLLVSYLLLAALHHALESGTGPSLTFQCEGDNQPNTFSARTILIQSSNFRQDGGKLLLSFLGANYLLDVLHGKSDVQNRSKLACSL